MTDQAPVRRPGFVTQRDGSPLASSNCRMASIAMGLDGAEGKTSTGAKMRSYTSDQSGGTDSGDAREAWDRGYNESLDAEDGKTWADALAALRAGRIVHLDVWHASVGGPCLSGTGGYGHTMAVIPDLNANGWLVGDPWCTTDYKRVTEAKLKAGAETWGGQVYGRAALESDWPSGGPINPRDAIVLAIVSRVAKRLMTEAYPGHEGRLYHDPPVDTGGAQPILYTITKPVPMSGGSDMFMYSPRRWRLPGGTDFYDRPSGTRLGALSSTQVVEATTLGGALTATGGVDWDWLPVLINSSLPGGERSWRVLWIKHPGIEPLDPASGWSTEALEVLNDYLLEAAPGGGGDVDAAVAARDEEWREWVLGGNPSE